MTELRKNFLTDESTGRVAKLDDMTDSVNIINYPHHEIHSASGFHAQVYGAAAAAVNIAFATPAGTKRAHMIFSFASESSSHLTVQEGATWTTGTGTVVAPINQLRGSLNESILLEDDTDTPNWTAGGVLTDVTNTDAGTALRTVYVFTDKKVGGDGAHDQEIVLAPDETYQMTLTSDDGAKNLVLHLDWYEHTDAT